MGWMHFLVEYRNIPRIRVIRNLSITMDKGSVPLLTLYASQ